MFAYIGWYTVALLWIFRMEKKMRKMQCYTDYIQGCTQYKSVYTDTRLYIHRWNLYIWVYTHMSKYKIVYTLMNAVYLRTSPYICVQVRIYAYVRVCDILQKHAWLADSNWESHAYCKAALTTTPPELIPNSVSYNICMLNWGLTLPSGWCRTSCAEPAAPPRQLWWVILQSWVSSLSHQGRLCPVASECHVIPIWVSLHISESE